MMWSLILTICMATEDGVACHVVKWHMIESKAGCLRMRNEQRAAIAEVEPLRIVAKCEQGHFG